MVHFSIIFHKKNNRLDLIATALGIFNKRKKILLILEVLEKKGLIIDIDQLFAFIFLLSLPVLLVQMIDKRQLAVFVIYTPLIHRWTVITW
jgi:hypothetical protein